MLNTGESSWSNPHGGPPTPLMEECVDRETYGGNEVINRKILEDILTGVLSDPISEKAYEALLPLIERFPGLKRRVECTDGFCYLRSDWDEIY